MKTIVPRKFANKYFNLMEAPLECWPEVTVVCIKGGRRPPEGEIVTIPTADVWVPGDFLSRRYATTPFWRIERWLFAHGHFYFTSMRVTNTPELEAPGDAPQVAPPFEGHSDADPGL